MNFEDFDKFRNKIKGQIKAEAAMALTKYRHTQGLFIRRQKEQLTCTLLSKQREKKKESSISQFLVS